MASPFYLLGLLFVLLVSAIPAPTPQLVPFSGPWSGSGPEPTHEAHSGTPEDTEATITPRGVDPSASSVAQDATSTWEPCECNMGVCSGDCIGPEFTRLGTPSSSHSTAASPSSTSSSKEKSEERYPPLGENDHPYPKRMRGDCRAIVDEIFGSHPRCPPKIAQECNARTPARPRDDLYRRDKYWCYRLVKESFEESPICPEVMLEECRDGWKDWKREREEGVISLDWMITKHWSSLINPQTATTTSKPTSTSTSTSTKTEKTSEPSASFEAWRPPIPSGSPPDCVQWVEKSYKQWNRCPPWMKEDCQNNFEDFSDTNRPMPKDTPFHCTEWVDESYTASPLCPHGMLDWCEDQWIGAKMMDEMGLSREEFDELNENLDVISPLRDPPFGVYPYKIPVGPVGPVMPEEGAPESVALEKPNEEQ